MEKLKKLGQGVLFMVKTQKTPTKNPNKMTTTPQPKSPMWFENLMCTACSKESERSCFVVLHCSIFFSCPSPHTCFIVMIILNIKFYFSFCLQRDFSACKPEQLIPPPLHPSWPWTRNSLCQSCFLVCSGPEPQMLWAGSESGHFCLIWLWRCWWIPGK